MQIIKISTYPAIKLPQSKCFKCKKSHFVVKLIKVKLGLFSVSGNSQLLLGYKHSGLDIHIQMAKSNSHLWLHDPDIKDTKAVCDN